MSLSSIQAQQEGWKFTNGIDGLREYTASKRILDYKNIQGSPFEKEEFMIGKIYMRDKQIALAKVRYDIYANEMEFVKDSSSIYYINKNSFDSILIDYKRYVYDRFSVSKKDLDSYFIVLVAGNYSLLLKKSIVFLLKELPKPFYEPKPDRFELRSEEYFLKFNNQSAKQIASKKQIKNNFPDVGDKALEYIKKEKISLSNQKDLIKLVVFLNT
jgi:hypothetical protein